MRAFFILIILTISTLKVFSQQSFPVNGVSNKNHTVYAFTNAKIFVDAETIIETGILLVKDGIIIGVGPSLNIPTGAVSIDLKSKTIYPGLIDTYTHYGMPEIKPVPKQRNPQPETNIKGAYGWNQAIKADYEAYKTFVADTKQAEEFRKLGFSTVLTFQTDGIIRGSASAVSLGETKENELIIKDRAASMMSFDKGTSTQEYPSSLMGAIALLRQTYLDAEWYKKDKTKKEYNISLDAFNGLQNLPQIFETNDKLSVLRADKIGDEFKVNYIIKGCGSEYQRIEEIKASNCKFILPLNFPMTYDVEDAYDALNVSLEELKHWENAPANTSWFEKNEIPFALTTADLKDKKDFYKNLRKAISYGLSEKQALKSLTSIPADLLGISEKVGALKNGMLANFIITSGNLFDEKTIIYENWIQGNPYKINDYNTIDIRGAYDLSWGNNSTTLKIEGDAVDKLKAVVLVDTAKKPANIVLSGNLVSISFTYKDTASVIRLSGNITAPPLKLSGNGQIKGGEWTSWVANYKSAFTYETKNDSTKKELPTNGAIIFPYSAYGKEAPTNPTKKDILIKHATVWTNEKEGILKNNDVFISNGRISKIAETIEPANSENTVIIDGTGKHLTPGIIDEHSHIAISAGVNEGTQASSAEVRIGDVINSEDINIYRQLSGGVTCAQLLHGSANPIGGQSAIIKLRWGKSPEAMKFENADGFIKFALGENVKQSNWGEAYTVRFPQSRMGVEQVYYDYFTRAKEYSSKQKIIAAGKQDGTTLRKDLELEALSEILNKKRFITCHSYVQSEINMLMHVGDSMGFRVNTFTHILEGYKVADKMKAHGAGASTFSDWWAYKMEVKDAIPYNASLLNQMGIVTAINSDDAEMGRRLNQEAAKTVKYGGTSEEDALKMVTLNPAKLLHIDTKVGSVKVGKDADLVLWSDHPLSVYAKAEKTIIDGVIYYDLREDTQLRDNNKKEQERIIQKMLREKKGGAPTQKPSNKKQKLYECDSMELDYTTEQ